MADLKKQIDRIMYVSGYVLNESPKYRPIIDDSSFDSMPDGWNIKEAETPAIEDTVAPLPASGATPSPATPPAPVAAPTPQSTSIAPELPKVEVAPETTTPFSSDGNTPPEETQPVAKDKDQLQNDVMKFQLDAMKKMSQKIDQLESFIDGLNAQQATLYSEVEKVKDPSDVEKFAERKQDSSPFYFNLNDMWNNNTFQGRMDNFNSKGMVKTDNGYIADYDTLPKLNSFEVKNSFEAI